MRLGIFSLFAELKSLSKGPQEARKEIFFLAEAHCDYNTKVRSVNTLYSYINQNKQNLRTAPSGNSGGRKAPLGFSDAFMLMAFEDSLRGFL